MKRAQSNSFVFVLLLILLFSFVVGISLAFIIHNVNKGDSQVSNINFVNKLKNKIGQISYGESRKVELIIPTSILKVCFYDPNPIPVNNNIKSDEFTPYLRGLFNGSNANVAIERSDKTFQTEEIKNLRLKGSYVKCYEHNGKLILLVKSVGNGEFTVEKIEHV